MGSYAESLLTKGEHVVVRQRQHWLALVLDSRLAGLLWLAAAACIVLLVVFRISGATGQVLGWLTLITVLAGIVVAVLRWWRWRTEEYLVTNRRLLKVSGIINKRSADSSLEKINDAILEENLLGRLLDYGDLDILTAAEVAVDRYRMLNHAKAFKKEMLTAKHDLEMEGSFRETVGPPLRTGTGAAGAAPGPGSAPAAPVPIQGRADTPDEVAGLLTQLAALRDAGHITASEYETKKRELLGRL